MDSSGSKTSCKNSTFGCTFGSSSVADMVKHFQWDCTIHPVRCFKCDKTVRKVNFEKHYMGYCRDNPVPPCPAPEDVPDVGMEEAISIMREQHFLRECVRECTQGLESVSQVMKDVAAEMKAMKAKQEDLETFVKGQAYIAKELSQSIMSVAEKVNKVQEDVNSVVNRLDKDAETILRRVEKVNDVVSHLETDVRSVVERVENVDGFLKESLTETKLCANMSRVMDNVAVDVAAVKLRTGEQQDLIKELEETVCTYAEKVKNVEEGIGTIVQRVEKLDGVIREVRVLARPLEDQSRIHWYVQNISQYIEKSKKGFSYVQSGIFVVRGYSARLSLLLQEWETAVRVGIFLALCRGPKDSLLQWPFRIPYTLSLIHPKDASKTKEHTTRPALPRSPESFEKPNKEENPNAGTFFLCTVEEARNEGFIRNDALLFGLTLHE